MVCACPEHGRRGGFSHSGSHLQLTFLSTCLSLFEWRGEQYSLPGTMSFCSSSPAHHQGCVEAVELSRISAGQTHEAQIPELMSQSSGEGVAFDCWPTLPLFVHSLLRDMGAAPSPEKQLDRATTGSCSPHMFLYLLYPGTIHYSEENG